MTTKQGSGVIGQATHQSESSSEHTSDCVLYLYSLFLIYFTQKTFSGNYIITYMIKKNGKVARLARPALGGHSDSFGGAWPANDPP